MRKSSVKGGGQKHGVWMQWNEFGFRCVFVFKVPLEIPIFVLKNLMTSIWNVAVIPVILNSFDLDDTYFLMNTTTQKKIKYVPSCLLSWQFPAWFMRLICQARKGWFSKDIKERSAIWKKTRLINCSSGPIHLIYLLNGIMKIYNNAVLVRYS